jgi:hypothetical protein
MKNALIILIFLFCPHITYTQTDHMQFEIDYLLDYVKNSGCVFIRNGRNHNPEEAVQHINRKFEYFRDKITTTEVFIDFCATKSTMSNKPYEIKCPGQPLVKSRDWLLKELDRIRAIKETN